MNAFQFLKWMRDYKSVPWSRENKPPEGERPSNSELMRWLRSGSVYIDGIVLKDGDEVTFPLETEPIQEIVFFPKGRRVTMAGFHR